jgi:hypothetical protein
MSSDWENEYESRESTESYERPGRYKSRFHEHMSQAYTAPPDFITSSPRPASPHKIPRKPVPGSPRMTHRHTPSVDSLTSISSTSSISSFSRIKRAFQKGARSSNEVGHGEFVIKGSSKTFRKDDIKLGGLTNSTVYFNTV